MFVVRDRPDLAEYVVKSTKIGDVANTIAISVAS